MVCVLSLSHLDLNSFFFSNELAKYPFFCFSFKRVEPEPKATMGEDDMKKYMPSILYQEIKGYLEKHSK